MEDLLGSSPRSSEKSRPAVLTSACLLLALRQLYFRSSGYGVWAVSLVLMFIANNASIFERAWIRTWTGAYPNAQHPPKEQFTTSSFTHHHHAATFVAYGHVAPQTAFTTGFSAANETTIGIAAYPRADTHPFYYLLIWTGASSEPTCASSFATADVNLLLSQPFSLALRSSH